MAPRFLLALLLVVSTVSAHSFCNESGWETIFFEGFDNPTLNASRWTVLNATSESDPSCGDARCMASNVEIAGGMLRLTAQKENSGWAEFTTGAVETRDKAFFDAAKSSFRMCIFAQLPGGSGGTGAGYFPAFRLFPNDDSCVPDHGELDMMEQLNGDDNIFATYRTAPAAAPACRNASSSEGSSLEELAYWYNEYAVEVNPDGTFDLLFNDDLVYEYNETLGLPTHVVPWFLNLGFGIGGDRPGPPNASTVFPAFVNIDWVQVVARSAR